MKIECPECSQRFDVTEEFMGKTVECGSCDNHFKVTDDVEVKDKVKFYPGEKHGAHLERFAGARASTEAATASSVAAAPVEFAEAHYQPDVDASRIGPPSPARTIAAVVGVSMMVAMIVVFLFAGGKEGAMRDMETTNRFILVGFAAIIGCFLVFYGTAQNRGKGMIACLLLGGGLQAMPVVFPGNPLVVSGGDISASSFAGGAGASESARLPEASEKESYLEKIGYFPVAEALELYPDKSVVAVYVRNASQSVRGKISDFLYVETGKLNRATSYNRGDMSDSDLYGLILMVKQKKSLDEIAILCNRFGEVNKIHHELRVIDVTVQRSKVISLDPETSMDPNSREFFREQLKALRSFDPAVNIKAAKRLAGSEPKVLRDDIAKQMVQMLPLSQNELKLELIHALQVWSKPGDGAETVVLEAVQALHQVGLVSKPAMSFLIDRQVSGSELILIDLWNSDPAAWSDHVQRLGEGAQVLLLPLLEEMDAVHIVAAADILGKVGASSSIPYLESVIEKQKEGGQKSLKAAIDEIKKRS